MTSERINKESSLDFLIGSAYQATYFSKWFLRGEALNIICLKFTMLLCHFSFNTTSYVRQEGHSYHTTVMVVGGDVSLTNASAHTPSW